MNSIKNKNIIQMKYGNFDEKIVVKSKSSFENS